MVLMCQLLGLLGKSKKLKAFILECLWNASAAAAMSQTKIWKEGLPTVILWQVVQVDEDWPSALHRAQSFRQFLIHSVHSVIH